MKKAVFIDRDGTINKEVSYLSEVSDIHILPKACRGIRRIADNGFMVIVITNQSGVARGYFDEERVKIINMTISEMLKKCGAIVHAWYYCPHHPDGRVRKYRSVCSCRKPAAGMILQAAKKHGIDCGSSFMIGDSLRDLQAGARAGCAPLLVRTGYGEELLHSGKLEKTGFVNVPVFSDLDEASRWIVKFSNRR